MKIIDYKNMNDITVEFQNEFKTIAHIYYQSFKSGNVLDNYTRNIFGVGYVGEGQYKCSKNGVHYIQYSVWYALLERCYKEAARKKYPTYEGCTVCDEWLNFQKFSQWYSDNIYDAGDGGRMHIDKDILVKGNKVYSPETCMFVPQRINMIFMSKSKNRDVDLPNAIYRCVTGFQAMYNGKSLGVFKTLDEAVSAHDSKKRIHIKQVADEYRDKIPLKVYDALLKW